MKIWTITTNDDDGIHTTVVYSQAAADIAERAYLISKWWGDIAALPADMEGARDAVYSQSGMLDSVHIADHDLSDHPAIVAADLELVRAETQLSGLMGEDGRYVTEGELIDLYDAVADAACLLRGNIIADEA